MDASNSSIRDINSLFTKKELKPSELYSIVFENAASSEAALHAHLTLFEEENIKKASESDKRFSKGEATSLLDGIPIAIKDNINIKNYKTTCSSKMLSNYTSPYDATVIEKLKKENTLFTGKTNLDEFGIHYFIKLLVRLGITIHDAELFFTMLTTISGTPALDTISFVSGCLQMKGLATSVDLHMLKFEVGNGVSE